MTLGMTNFFRISQSTPTLPAGLRVYAIGDIHGRLDLLEEMATQIRADLVDAPGEVLTIFLGDYVDRGPHSSQVIEKLAVGCFPTPILTLRGNHEEVALQFLEEESVLESWRKFGGLETLHSYRVNIADVMRGKGYAQAREQFMRNFPDRHRKFLEETKLSATFGDYFFCHAGVQPGIPLEQQSAKGLLWIRDEFLNFEGFLGKVVVHGHTPVSAPDIRPNRINVDTGAYATSCLTALVLQDAERRILTAGNARPPF